MYWQEFERLKCLPDKCNCEPIHWQSWIMQPNAVITSIPFIGLGIYFSTKKETSFHFKTLSYLFILLGFSSMFLHSSLVHIATFCDFGSIFAIISWALSYLYLREKSKILFLSSILTLTIIATSGIYFFPLNPIPVFCGFFIPAVLLVAFYLIKNKPRLKNSLKFSKAVIYTALGGLFFHLDQEKIFCFEKAHLFGHSLWHILVTFAMYEYYTFFTAYHKENLNDDAKQQKTNLLIYN